MVSAAVLAYAEALAAQPDPDSSGAKLVAMQAAIAAYEAARAVEEAPA